MELFLLGILLLEASSSFLATHTQNNLTEIVLIKILFVLLTYTYFYLGLVS